MNVWKKKPYAILVFGAPMSGKTFFAEQFSQSIRAPFLNIARLEKKFGSDRKLADELITQMAKSKADLIIEGYINTEEQRKEMRELLKKLDYQPVLVWVQTDLNTIKQRMRNHYRKLDAAKEALAESYKHIEAPTADENPIVISGKHTFRTQCQNVVSRLNIKDVEL